MLRKIAASMVVLLAGLPACGGGGGGGSSLSPYTGLTTPAVITSSNADNIARQAFQGGDLGASTALAPSRPGGTPGEAGKPMALTLLGLTP